ncbi:hypothetical protein VIM7927_01335 [Vibrio mangrovi]|uniref:Uncharacterized protein n=1 Tax=Vibrio mangrovi TaxID=474394 RepID=A0A1Y6IR16_9VIBR|nr:hypothetical protein VIM7927_01335 [Vibrio mangrovi]
MIWVFLPLMIVLFQWKSFEIRQWQFTAYYLLYAIVLTTLYQQPISPYLGSFYLGIPAMSYISFLFPGLQSYYPESAVRMVSVAGLSITFLVLIISLLFGGALS